MMLCRNMFWRCDCELLCHLLLLVLGNSTCMQNDVSEVNVLNLWLIYGFGKKLSCSLLFVSSSKASDSRSCNDEILEEKEQ